MSERPSSAEVAAGGDRGEDEMVITIVPSNASASRQNVAPESILVVHSPMVWIPLDSIRTTLRRAHGTRPLSGILLIVVSA